ncbi:protein tyrosine-phosphatase [Listeria floridensis FSL S10-1187]|uniref:Tyrosine-protein phosphatase n=1 Tax=Listeria floridensis FSL S10-1187 TaxID=1265817 RepID=A0ABN0RFX3_9LIST|nr:CpsB/CapC family capsule biosynthesis tyrosine phosphatase [Listeria floridensis]EUJ32298.1 protein tyrosine-phosphatase [Listeria floridensis FSL S10-1187]
MIDIHCHILNGIDDGPKELDDSLRMARQAVAEGFTDIIATPHHLKGGFVNPGDEVKAKVEHFNEILQKEAIPLMIHPGQEVRIHGEMIDNLENGSVLSLAGSRYILIEFPTESVPLFAQELFFKLQMKGYIPVIAHPERNVEIKRNYELLYEFVESGSLGQLTWGSYSGRFGKKIKKFSEQLLEANLVHFMATDAHFYERRSMEISKPLHDLRRDIGREGTGLLLNNSKLLLNDEVIQLEEPEKIKKRFFLF